MYVRVFVCVGVCPALVLVLLGCMFVKNRGVRRRLCRWKAICFKSAFGFCDCVPWLGLSLVSGGSFVARPSGDSAACTYLGGNLLQFSLINTCDQKVQRSKELYVDKCFKTVHNAKVEP